MKKFQFMRKFQFATIIASALLYCWMLLGVSCNKCSSKDETTVVTSETDTVYSHGNVSDNDTEAEYDNGSKNNSAIDNTSGAAANNNTDSGTKKDTVKKVPSGGTTAKEARFSSSGSN